MTVPGRTIDWDEVERLTKAGRSASEIAAELKCSVRSVTRVRTAMECNVSEPVPEYPPEYREIAGRMLDDGASFSEIDRTLGTSHRWCAKHFPGRGWTRQQSLEFRQIRLAEIELEKQGVL